MFHSFAILFITTRIVRAAASHSIWATPHLCFQLQLQHLYALSPGPDVTVTVTAAAAAVVVAAAAVALARQHWMQARHLSWVWEQQLLLHVGTKDY